MRIVADENIPYAREAFSGLGDVTLVHGRNIPSLRNCDALIVRSITKVNEALLAGTPVRFVGTSTIGYDHIDREYLETHDIGFASAPGSNSNSVSEYVTAALLVYAHDRGIRLEGKSIGVIGIGNVGSKVARKCAELGMTVLKNDPPLKDATGDPAFLPLEEVLTADFITLHVPLVKDGKYPTFHMVNRDFTDAVHGVLINSSRGSVVDETALHGALGRNIEAAILDVWENEPHIDRSLAEKVYGTPHIAGYSFDGKVNGTQMMYDAVCRHFGIEPTWKAAGVLPPGKRITCSGAHDEDCIRDAVLQVYDIRKDFATFRQSMAEFDRLRKEYPVRREFPTTEVVPGECSSAAEKLRGLGFVVV
ncbi:4-phosphoerythronate dehydrogenase [bacterium]|nr:4-phosphoerythronate dehydrogenase [bacterium]